MLVYKTLNATKLRDYGTIIDKLTNKQIYHEIIGNSIVFSSYESKWWMAKRKKIRGSCAITYAIFRRTEIIEINIESKDDEFTERCRSLDDDFPGVTIIVVEDFV